jgi:hypothetical protein
VAAHAIPGERRRRRLAWAACLALLLSCSTHAWALTEDEAKAAFVFNFAKFTDWPAASFADGRTPLRVCVLNATGPLQDAFASLDGRAVKGREIRTQALSKLEPGAGCHILFLPGLPPERAGEVLAATRRQPVLTVSDVAGVAEGGAMIGLVPAAGKLQIVVNLDEVTVAGLSMSSQVLRLARIVKKETK